MADPQSAATVSANPPATVSAIVVAYADPTAARRAIESLVEQSHPPTEILLVDNDPGGATASALAGSPMSNHVRLVHSGENLGYTAACNLAASEAAGAWLLFVNPDARLDAGCIEAMVGATRPTTGVIGAQILLLDGRTNAGHNPVHITGLSWAGRYGEPPEHGLPRPVVAVSGAVLMARTKAYRDAAGMCPRFFMYHDDVDLCWRMALAGWEIVFCPQAVAWHEYEFDKGQRKWYWLERNRLWSVLSNYSGTSLALLSPLLLGAEFVIAVEAIRGRWTRNLLRAWLSDLRSGPELLRWRRAVQATRRTPDSQLLARMTAHFQTPLLPSAAGTRLGWLVESYRRLLLWVLPVLGR